MATSIPRRKRAYSKRTMVRTVAEAPVAPADDADVDQSIDDFVHSNDDHVEACDFYLAAIETGKVSEEAFVAAIILTEELRMENRALKAFLGDPKLKVVTVGYVPMSAESDILPEEAQKMHARFGRLFGERVFARKAVIPSIGEKTKH